MKNKADELKVNNIVLIKDDECFINNNDVHHDLKIKELNKKRDDLIQKINSIHETMDLLSQDEDHLSDELIKVEKQIHHEIYVVPKKQKLSDNEIADQLSKVRRVAIAATVAVWLF